MEPVFIKKKCSNPMANRTSLAKLMFQDCKAIEKIARSSNGKREEVIRRAKWLVERSDKSAPMEVKCRFCGKRKGEVFGWEIPTENELQVSPSLIACNKKECRRKLFNNLNGIVTGLSQPSFQAVKEITRNERERRKLGNFYKIISGLSKPISCKQALEFFQRMSNDG